MEKEQIAKEVVDWIQKPIPFEARIVGDGGEDQEAVAGQAQIFIEKQRNGPTGDIDLMWKKEYTRFEDRAPERFDEFDDYNANNLEAQEDPF